MLKDVITDNGLRRQELHGVGDDEIIRAPDDDDGGSPSCGDSLESQGYEKWDDHFAKEYPHHPGSKHPNLRRGRRTGGGRRSSSSNLYEEPRYSPHQHHRDFHSYDRHGNQYHQHHPSDADYDQSEDAPDMMSSASSRRRRLRNKLKFLKLKRRSKSSGPGLLSGRGRMNRGHHHDHGSSDGMDDMDMDGMDMEDMGVMDKLKKRLFG